MGKITIAIDGYSSTGKSTIAKRLAASLNYIYVDTGAMYRAVTLFALQAGIIDKDGHLDEAGLVDKLSEIHLQFVPNEETGRSEMYLNDQNVEQEIRTMHVSGFVSKVAAIKEVREKLVKMQQAMGKNKGIVMDGRDIGTVVFPEAELKLFMTASPETRATRRYKELLEKGEAVTYEEVLRNVEERDRIDSTRTVSPLTKAKDAIEFDNSDMGLEEQFERIHDFAQRVMAKVG
ncbi:MAG: (d)CMP kinase [Muricauda sp.]|jgi:cytidylate kinase|nr:(d)CMP kinase [Allomuricauda sp.]MBO6590268.1 (d)CMP kinase [Allomuricauda sp.]MBO6619894.1 (d)CMP kinase [Allomuricauda sp.]MBO6645764.1 (d)CMP kinase [Allomuricauda sp.]MBO6748232.1 (d)CMP kinase [Allomuricauda sp.]MBO6843598.1 (d)CMP kinase [Allomuricauda sp.]